MSVKIQFFPQTKVVLWRLKCFPVHQSQPVSAGQQSKSNGNSQLKITHAIKRSIIGCVRHRFQRSSSATNPRKSPSHGTKTRRLDGPNLPDMTIY